MHEAATGWAANPLYGPTDPFPAACQAQADGLDPPALCELAGASVRDSASDDVEELLTRALDELRATMIGSSPGPAALSDAGRQEWFAAPGCSRNLTSGEIK